MNSERKSPSATVLVVDDEQAARYATRRSLQSAGYEVVLASSGEGCLEELSQQRVWVVLLDVSMPGMGGLRCLDAITRSPEHPPVIMVTAYGSERIAVDCLKAGAYDYLPKPFELDELLAVVGRAVERVTLQLENRKLRAVVDGATSFLLGRSESMRAIDRLIDRLAPSDVSVLIQGESGTGKEVVARELHRRSNRRASAFVAVNSAALPDELVESELFGHERGAFTGAFCARRGRFEQAHLGTLFLDEIGEMSARHQTKLLRVLQERTFERVGGQSTIEVDVRVLAASNRDLKRQVEAGRFRDDLYYRLKVAQLELPPLRERREDVAVLAAHFLNRNCVQLDRECEGFSPQALDVLNEHHWPGNVRELENAVQYALVMNAGGPIEPDSLPADLMHPASRQQPAGAHDRESRQPYQEARRAAIHRFEGRYLSEHLERAKGNVSEAARTIGIARQSLQAKLHELDIDAKNFRPRTNGRGREK